MITSRDEVGCRLQTIYYRYDSMDDDFRTWLASRVDLVQLPSPATNRTEEVNEGVDRMISWRDLARTVNDSE